MKNYKKKLKDQNISVHLGLQAIICLTVILVNS